MSASDPPRASDPGPAYTLAAPAAAPTTPMFFPPRRDEWPSLDDRLAEPETPEEVIRGERYFNLGSLDPHADQHFRLDYVLGPYVQEGYVGATDLLTRSSINSDFASDTCIRRDGKDPATGTRFLEEIAFEIVNEQPLAKVTAKAEDLSRRGVRRIFAIFVKTREVKEWSKQANAFRSLRLGSYIHDDRCLRQPMPVQALLDAAKADVAVVTAVLAKNNPEADNAAASALVDKGNPVLMAREAASRADGFKEGEAKGTATAVLTLLSARGIAVSDADRSRILACRDTATLNRWLVAALHVSSAEEITAG